MRNISCLPLYGLLTAIGLSSWTGPVTAGTLPAAAFASKSDTALIEVGRRWYRGYRDDFYYPPEYYLPPPPPVVVYEPPVYGWLALPPPPPSSCGKYRYWNGERCADARYDPPYIGPRW
ncbi:hypothetical protein [Hyphomicrobium sp.]|uniref:hypothetical protein n=1 Tax=Hyphomicrobium sp. TaxID=82 RepID=UPI0025BD0B2F|nr:hypothetical protein [Hyphomicrobium sp.]MCC7250428.1 hypothetical protein [Hyphomicrobium sp.]